MKVEYSGLSILNIIVTGKVIIIGDRKQFDRYDDSGLYNGYRRRANHF